VSVITSLECFFRFLAANDISRDLSRLDIAGLRQRVVQVEAVQTTGLRTNETPTALARGGMSDVGPPLCPSIRQHTDRLLSLVLARQVTGLKLTHISLYSMALVHFLHRVLEGCRRYQASCTPHLKPARGILISVSDMLLALAPAEVSPKRV
jgi:hypothetical protein